MSYGVIWVALGGAAGSAARYGVTVAAARLVGSGFPWATLAVNVVGSFAMGLLMAFLMRKMPNDDSTRLFLATGILGGFTTFSAFSMDVLGLVQRGENALAMIYVLASVGLSLLAVFAGFYLAVSVVS